MADPNATTCAACGSHGELHEHHLVPRVEGGASLPTVMLCISCHSAVHGRSFSIHHADMTRRGLEKIQQHIAEHGYWIGRRSGRRITRLGNENSKGGTKESARFANLAQQRQARERASDLMPYIDQIKRAGIYTLGGIAEALTARGIKTPGGCSYWSAEQVRRVIKQAKVSA